MSQAGPVETHGGWCPCCRAKTVFEVRSEWRRDTYTCAKCGSIPRQRHIQVVLDERFPGWEAMEVHESSPSCDFISRYCPGYTCSQLFDDVPRGQVRDGVRSEDIEVLTFADESLDLFITQDVLEHVFRPDRAIAEIHRVLRPGGAHVFTAPKYQFLLETLVRARLEPDGTVTHLMEPAWHGNPIGDNRALVTYDYGYDFELLLSDWSGTSVEVVHTRDRRRGLDAEANEVFVIRKPGPGTEPRQPAVKRSWRSALSR